MGMQPAKRWIYAAHIVDFSASNVDIFDQEDGGLHQQWGDLTIVHQHKGFSNENAGRPCSRTTSTTTVDGRNLAPVDRWFIPLFIGFQPSKVVQDFFHQQ